MAMIYLTLDSGKPERDGRTATIDALVSAEVERIFDEFGPVLREMRGGRPVEEWGESDAAVAAWLTEHFPPTGHANDHTDYPYSQYAVALMRERRATPYHQTEQAICQRCGKEHPKLWRIERRLADTFGAFACFRINGETVPVDSTLPHEVARLPRDAREVSAEISAYLWHSDSHHFGQVIDMGALLRGAALTTVRQADLLENPGAVLTF